MRGLGRHRLPRLGMSRRAVARTLLAILALTGLIWAWTAERGSVERANRLQRAGDPEAAAAVYRARAAAAPSDAELRYNLGTALAALDDPEAEVELERATPSPSREIRARAEYNLGFLRLETALEGTDPDSVRAAASGAVEANRAALRLRPGDPDAKWNLAMAVRLLDSIASFERRSGREQTDGAMEADVVTRSVNVPDPAEDEFAEDPPDQGEEETVVTLGDESPLSLQQAEEILGTGHLDPTSMLQKLFSLEGRNRPMTRRQGTVRRW